MRLGGAALTNAGSLRGSMPSAALLRSEATSSTQLQGTLEVGSRARPMRGGLAGAAPPVAGAHAWQRGDVAVAALATVMALTAWPRLASIKGVGPEQHAQMAVCVALCVVLWAVPTMWPALWARRRTWTVVTVR